MPIYEYECNSCGEEHELIQNISARPLRKCPACGRLKLRRKISRSAFHLKGEGWYASGYSKNGDKNGDKDNGDKSKDNGDTGKDKSESKSDSPAKTEVKAESKSSEVKFGGEKKKEKPKVKSAD